MAALIIMVASTIVFVRLLIIISAVEPALLSAAGPPIGVILAVMSVTSLIYWRISKKEAAELPPQGNPSELKAALIFAALYAIILVAVAAARERFGSSGVFVVTILSGLTDMDAITLSLSEMVQRKQISPDFGWRLIVTGALSNLVFKAGAVAILGSRRLLARIAVLFSIALATGLAVALFWPRP